MSDEDKAKEAQAQLEAKLRSEISAEISASLTAEHEAEIKKIVGNRDEILGEKRALQEQYKDIDPAKLQEFRDLQKKAETDDLLRLASEGKMDELSNRLTQSQRDAWDEKSQEYETRLTEKTGLLEGLEEEVASLKQTNTNMSKTQYLKELTSTDDAFKADYFSHFTKLYMDRLDIDTETGSVYALDERGKRIVDTSGDLETFKSFYNKQKSKRWVILEWRIWKRSLRFRRWGRR